MKEVVGSTNKFMETAQPNLAIKMYIYDHFTKCIDFQKISGIYMLQE